MRLSTPILVLLACVAACKAQQPGPPRTLEADAPPPVLYGRDGKPVGAAPRSVAADSTPTDGRLTLLELYQTSCQERDALLGELELVRADLDRTQAALLEAQAKIAGYETESADEAAQLEALRAENLELAARLATAHVRRMEAEKRVLELELEALEKAAAAESAAQAEHGQ
ncbi:MAG: hypothetical protein L6Q99_03210 [Planctomycetes bacterium]|nr:hypothetical protein [Planctomycetota bacterium]